MAIVFKHFKTKNAIIVNIGYSRYNTIKQDSKVILNDKSYLVHKVIVTYPQGMICEANIFVYVIPL